MAHERRPAARASAARDNVSFAETFRPGSLEAIRGLIPAGSLEAIDKTPGFSWLEFEHDHWLMDATVEVLGQADAIACWRASLLQLVEKPLLRNFVEGSLRLFGSEPGKLLKMIPKGWTLAYRDFCTPRFERLENQSAVIHFEDIASQAFQSEGYLHCWHAVCLGIFDIEKPSNARVDFEIDRRAARARAIFSWG